MKKIALIAALASTLVAPMAANAATVSGPFNVTVAFTPSCTVTVAARAIAFTYTAFAAAPAAVAVSAPVVLTCSRGIGAVATAGYGEGGEAAGLIGASNLRYTLSAPAKTNTPGTAATGTVAGNVGTPDSVSFTFTGTLPQQAGAGASDVVVNATDARTLVVTF
jgi:hypothetical protein